MSSGDEERIRTLFITYESNQDSADTFMIVLGSIAENFRGVKVVEYQDDSLFEDNTDMVEVLHQMRTKEERLSKEQRAELKKFTETLNEWTGDE